MPQGLLGNRMGWSGSRGCWVMGEGLAWLLGSMGNGERVGGSSRGCWVMAEEGLAQP